VFYAIVIQVVLMLCAWLYAERGMFLYSRELRRRAGSPETGAGFGWYLSALGERDVRPMFDSVLNSTGDPDLDRLRTRVLRRWFLMAGTVFPGFGVSIVLSAIPEALTRQARRGNWTPAIVAALFVLAAVILLVLISRRRRR
jgi:hypothetical protein